MNKIRTLFMGTPEFAEKVLAQLYTEDRIEVCGVVCQPDKEVGRKKILTACPVKILASQHNTLIIQPKKLKEEFQEILDLKPELIITCAYGQMVPDDVLNCPRLGSFNLHGSLLPKYRGGAPMQRAIMNGDAVTGMTLQRMASKMDAGEMLAKLEVKIPTDYTYGKLADDMANAACKLIHEHLDSLLDGTFNAEEQNEEDVTFAWIIKPEEEKIELTGRYEDAYNKIRGLIPSPCGYVMLEDKKLKLCGIVENNEKTDKEDREILPFANGCLCVALDKRVLMFDLLQLEGKQICTGKDFKNGHNDIVGKKLN